MPHYLVVDSPMESSNLAAEDIWQCWKKHFGPWLRNYYGDIAGIRFNGDEWTQGVINPFVVTQLAPELEYKVRLLQDRKDIVLLDREMKNEVVHMEHENELKDIVCELPKLKASAAPLKCIVSYGDTYGDKPIAIERNVEQLKKFVAEILEPILHDDLRKAPSHAWLMICGVNWASPYSEKDWVAYSFTRQNNESATLSLS